MRRVALAEIIEPSGGRARHGNQLPVYSVTKHAGFVPSLEYFKKQVFSKDTSGYRVVEPGEFAYATIHLDEGSIDISPERCIISPMYSVFKVKESAADPQYLIRYLKSPIALAHYESLGRGAIHRRKSISLEALGTIEVPLPTLAEQRRIAAILDQIDALRHQRLETVRELSSLPGSLFTQTILEHAGRHHTTRLSKVAELTGGRNLVADDPGAPSAFRVIKISAVTTGVFKPAESKPLPHGYTPPEAHLIRSEDLLMSRANTSELVGAVAFVPSTPENLALPDKIWRFNWHDRRSEPLFYRELMASSDIRRKVSRMSSGTGGSMKNIPKAKLYDLELPDIPVDIQRRFAEDVRMIERQRERAERAVSLCDELFTSLQALAFSGRL